MPRFRHPWLVFSVDPDLFDASGESADSEDNDAPPTLQPETATTTNGEPPRRYTEADLNKARTEEKDKLYKTIEGLKGQVENLTAAQQEEQRRREELAAQQAEEERRKAEEEMSVRQLLTAKEQEWQAQLEAERQAREALAAQLQEERRVAALRAYQDRRLAEVGDDIIPELLDLVGGNTEQEIEASISGLRERSLSILASSQQASDLARRETTGARVTAPSAELLDNYSGSRRFTADDISNMSMEEFAAYRAQLLGAESGNQGLFG